MESTPPGQLCSAIPHAAGHTTGHAFPSVPIGPIGKLLLVKTSELFQFPKQLPVIGIQVLGIGHPVVCIKPPGQNTSSSSHSTGHTLGHVTPSIPSGAIFHEMINVLHARKDRKKIHYLPNAGMHVSGIMQPLASVPP